MDIWGKAVGETPGWVEEIKKIIKKLLTN
jgi:hypothetical protein